MFNINKHTAQLEKHFIKQLHLRNRIHLNIPANMGHYSKTKSCLGKLTASGCHGWPEFSNPNQIQEVHLIGKLGDPMKCYGIIFEGCPEAADPQATF